MTTVCGMRYTTHTVRAKTDACLAQRRYRWSTRVHSVTVWTRAAPRGRAEERRHLAEDRAVLQRCHDAHAVHNHVHLPVVQQKDVVARVALLENHLAFAIVPRVEPNHVPE